ncbi:hypothetical protein CYFUS_000810 [Cystobacter fuscus]|uniref:Uncharacterized protein n=1 Tax=Cystobacter fuscus TaxID=43 RepID=A0A250IW16_9BACT|nr:hypothetical protein CYFUS_000810 [Cystobacter fuscus]
MNTVVLTSPAGGSRGVGPPRYGGLESAEVMNAVCRPSPQKTGM